MFVKRKKADIINLRVRLIRKPSVVCAGLPDGGAILLNLEDNYFYTLNEIALRVWNLTDGKRSISDIIEILLKEYNIDRLRITKSVSRQMKEFVTAGLTKAKE